MTGRPRLFRGIGASPGIASGRVLLLDQGRLRVPRHHLQADQIDHEIRRLREAIDAAVAQLDAAQALLHDAGVESRSIVEAHAMMLKDSALFAEIAGAIRSQQINAEWAVTRVVGRWRSLFAQVADTYLRERRSDIDFVGQRLLQHLGGKLGELPLNGLPEAGTIIVAHELSPVSAVLLARQRVTALVTEAGGKTSHTSIVARSLEIPAVVGTVGVLDAAGNGDLVIVDGHAGTVQLRPTRAHLERSRQRDDRDRRRALELLETRSLPAATADGTSLVIAGNIELPIEVTTVVQRGGEAIGLYRTEFLFAGRAALPDEEDHYRTYSRIFDEIGDRPVTIRTLDLGGEKVFAALRNDPEPNPALGLRAIRYCLAHPELFTTQLAGLLRASAHGPLRILLPMISSLDELRFAREQIAEVGDELRGRGRTFADRVPVGVMLEVPSAVLIVDHLAEECDFFAVGTNDLVQYLLAADRSNARVDYLYSAYHPAVLRALRAIITAAAARDRPVSICGEAAGDPQFLPLLIGLGFRQLSMSPSAIPPLKQAVRQLRAADCERLVEAAAQATTQREVVALTRDFLHANLGPAYRELADR